MPQYKPVLVKDDGKRRYTREELQEMTTVQLRSLCYAIRIVQGMAYYNLDRESLIRLILKYRGVERSLLIDRHKKNGFEKVADALSKYLGAVIPGQDKIKIPAKITFYHELDLSKDDLYKVTTTKDIEESNVLLINESNELCGILNLVKEASEERRYYLVAAKANLKFRQSNNRNYSLLFFRKDDSEYLYKTYYSDKLAHPTSLACYKVPIVDLEIRNLETTSIVLGIDFGTSNTTAGAYLTSNYVTEPCYNDILNERIRLNEINFVKFMDVTTKEEKYVEALPTVIYTANCADPDNVQFFFGYEAKQLIKKNDYTGNASVFQGIKRWVNDYEKVEEIFDEHGNMALMKRGHMIRAYLQYVIDTAERQFKCRFKNLHISSPVKLKSQFIKMFRDILPDYHVESEEVLDEGMAVLYNTIADQIEMHKFVDGKEYKALVIDCGGGTTDLSSCVFKIIEDYISYKVEIHTTFENGDTNFGGNNITYRILQFMKIVFAHYYRNKKGIITIDELIEVPNTDIFRYVDEMGTAKVYEKFEAAYEGAEKVIPTRFKEYENHSRDEYQRVKNNYYFLWEIADNMKKEFFQKTNILRNRFVYSDIDERESDLHITTLNKWCLSLRDNNQGFKYEYDFPDVVFNIKEINKLIKADIYDVVRKFLEKFYENRELQSYSLIKLTGQSCRIDIFREALKEFVPGRSIEFRQKKAEDEFVPDLKLSCLRGILRYINSKTIGEIEATISNEVHVIPYSITAFTHTKQEKTLISSLEKMNQAKGFISRPIGTQEVIFYLKSQEGVLQGEYVYNNNVSTYKPATADDICSQYKGIIFQEDTDTIRNGEARFFVFTPNDNWGFEVLPIARMDDQLYVGDQQYFAFEDDLSELDFFDGLK